MLRIGIADDHQLIRKSLSMLIQTFEGVSVVLQAENGTSLIKQLEDIEIDLLLLDIQMPGMDGFEVCKHLKKHNPEIKILIVSHLTTKESIHRVMECGAHGYFTKNSDPLQLEHAIRSIREKDFYFGHDLGFVIREAILWEKNSRAMQKQVSVSFTSRELEIISMAFSELSSYEIAERLFINVRTVETHRKRIMDKTGSKNFIGVIVFALRHGHISLDEI